MAHQSRAQKAKAATRALPEEEPEFQIAPMIDILLVLLIFFMSIATEQVLQVNKDVVLPVAKDALEQPDKGKPRSEMIVNVTWDPINQKGTIIVDEKPIEMAALTTRVQTQGNNNPDFRIVVRADKGTKWAYTRAAMVAVSAGGAGKVVFSVTDKEIPKKAQPTN